MRKLGSLPAHLDMNLPCQNLTAALDSIPEANATSTAVETAGIDSNTLRQFLAKPNDRNPYRSIATGGFTTWQRGFHAIKEKMPHFPEILRVKQDESPLMYNMYRPLPHWQCIETSSLNSVFTRDQTPAVNETSQKRLNSSYPTDQMIDTGFVN